jgi:hypothetical protein
MRACVTSVADEPVVLINAGKGNGLRNFARVARQAGNVARFPAAAFEATPQGFDRQADLILVDQKNHTTRWVEPQRVMHGLPKARPAKFERVPMGDGRGAGDRRFSAVWASKANSVKPSKPRSTFGV